VNEANDGANKNDGHNEKGRLCQPKNSMVLIDCSNRDKVKVITFLMKEMFNPLSFIMLILNNKRRKQVTKGIQEHKRAKHDGIANDVHDIHQRPSEAIMPFKSLLPSFFGSSIWLLLRGAFTFGTPKRCNGLKEVSLVGFPLVLANLREVFGHNFVLLRDES